MAASAKPGATGSGGVPRFSRGARPGNVARPRSCWRPSGHCPLLIVLLAVSLGMILDRGSAPAGHEVLAERPGPPQPISVGWSVCSVTWTLLAGGRLPEDWPWRAWLACWLLGLLSGAAGCAWRLGAGPRWREAGRCTAVGGILLACFAAGGAWHHAQWRLFDVHDLGRLARGHSQPVCVEVVALEPPRWRPSPPPDPMRAFEQTDSSRWAARAERVRSGAAWWPATGQVEVRCGGRVEGIRAGDRLRIFGSLRGFTDPLNPGEGGFAEYARGRRRLCQIHAESPEAVQRLAGGSRGWDVRQVLQSVRLAGQEILRRDVGPSRGPLAAALLLGLRDELGREQARSYLVTGTLHVLAISGLHVGLLAGGLWWVARTVGLPRAVALGGLALLALTYAALTELRPPVFRASLLVAAWAAGRWLERRVSPLNTLAAAALAVLLVQPSSLFETGAQLSFLAVATLGCCFPDPVARNLDPLDRLLRNSRPWPLRMARRLASDLGQLWLRGAVIWLVSLPLVLDRFHIVSFTGLILNLFIWPPLVVSLLAGLATLLVGGLLPGVGAWSGRVCDWGLATLEAGVHTAAALPAGFTWAPAPPAWYLLAFYAVWGAYLVFPAWRPRPAVALLLLVLGSLAAGLLQPLARHVRYAWTCPGLTVTFVAVGHGTCVLCEFPDGSTLLYDAGCLSSPEGAAESISACLWSRGLTSLDRVVISHADADHYNAFPRLLERFRVQQLMVEPRLFERPPPPVQAVRESFERAGVVIRHWQAGDSWQVDEETRVDVLHPPPEGVPGNDNANSLVLLIHHRDHRLLLPGDLEGAGLDRLLRQSPQTCQVVLAPHHGSRHSRPVDVARWAQPQWMIVSGGHGRDEEALAVAERMLGVRVLHTSRLGAIRVELGVQGVRTGSWLGSRLAMSASPETADRVAGEANPGRRTVSYADKEVARPP